MIKQNNKFISLNLIEAMCAKMDQISFRPKMSWQQHLLCGLMVPLIWCSDVSLLFYMAFYISSQYKFISLRSARLHLLSTNEKRIDQFLRT